MNEKLCAGTSIDLDIPRDAPVSNEMGQKYRVEINQLDRGFLVNVGCKSFTFSDLEELLVYLEQYLRDRKGIEELFNKGELF